MDIEKIRELTKLMNEEGISKLSVKDENGSLKLVSNRDKTFKENLKIDKKEKLTSENDNSDLIHEIRATQVGIVYLTNVETNEKYITEGDNLVKGQKLAEIEAMKIFNDLDAPCDGVVEKIHVKDRQFVEYGELLISVNVVS